MDRAASAARRSRRRRRTPADVSGWRSWGPPAAVIVTLAALLLVPVLIRRERAEIRREVVRVARPALALTTRLGVAYAREAVAYRNFLLTGDPEYLQNYRAARRLDREIVAELRPLTRRLGPRIEERLDRALIVAVAWQAAPDSLITGEVSREALIRRTGEQQEAYIATLEHTRALSRAIADRIERLDRRIDAIDQRAQEATALLTALALVAAVIVVRLDRRRRRYAADVDRRRRDEVALRRAAERITAATTLDEAGNVIVSTALRATEADGGVLERRTADGMAIEAVAVAGDPALAAGVRGPYPGSLAERALRGGEPLRLDRLREGAFLLSPSPGERCADCPALVAPLAAGDRAIGALLLLRRPGRAGFGDEDVERARTLAELASLALRKVELLEEARDRGDQLAAALESRALLIRGFSHDVKNPLAAASGYLELLDRGAPETLPERALRHIRRIGRLIDIATRLTDNLVTLARAEAGELPLEQAPVDVCAIAREAAEDYRGDADVAGLSLGLDLPPACPLIESDGARIGQILSNLLSNAIKYTPAGGRIDVRGVLREGAGAPGPGRWVCIEVSDTGPGIPEEQHDVVFDEFTRVSPGQLAAHGAGLGLAIARRLARLLGGDITLRSRIGEGSTFTLWLPARRRYEAPAEAA